MTFPCFLKLWSNVTFSYFFLLCVLLRCCQDGFSASRLDCQMESWCKILGVGCTVCWDAFDVATISNLKLVVSNVRLVKSFPLSWCTVWYVPRLSSIFDSVSQWLSFIQSLSHWTTDSQSVSDRLTFTIYEASQFSSTMSCFVLLLNNWFTFAVNGKN